MTGMRRLAVLASGRGSNLAAIADACADGRIAAEPALVLSNVAGAGALELARQRGIPARCIPHGDYPSREDFDAALLAALAEARIDFVALAGFMRVLTERFVREYYGSLLNIHPSLLPKYPGLHTHRRAIEAGDGESGATVHYVVPALDAGPAVLRGRVAIAPTDTPETLAARVQQVEHRIYPQALAWCIAGKVTLEDGVAFMDGEVIADGGVELQLD
jgi:phosphoribosylglycinamide formyltransferase-1